MPIISFTRAIRMDSLRGNDVVFFLTLRERQALRCVCRRWHFTCTWLANAGDSSSKHDDTNDALLPRKKSVWNLQSRRFRHVWHSFVHRAGEELLPHVLQRLPHVDKLDTYALTQGLCASTNTGVRPSFDNAHARSGYIQAKINRCGNLSTLLLTPELASLRSELFRIGRARWTVALYGGGPGFDAAGLAFLCSFLRARDIRFHVNVYDNEPGWAPAVMAMQQALETQYNCSSSSSSSGALDSDSAMSWGFHGCDITVDVNDAVNAAVQRDVASTQLFVFSFVCVENFQLLQQSAFAFLRSLFQDAAVGSAFVFTDSTHRLWPLIYDVARATTAHFRVWTPHARGCHYALVLQKQSRYSAQRRDSDPPFFAHAMAKLALFRQHQRQHEQWKQ